VTHLPLAFADFARYSTSASCFGSTQMPALTVLCYSL
jgi:hypothetical protein